LYTRKAQIELPAIDKPVGFDLIKFDWLSPYGNGVNADFVFLAQKRWVSRKDFDCSLKVAFTNADDGLLPFQVPKDDAGQLRLPAMAPLDGYLPDFSKSLSHTLTNGWEGDDAATDQNYYFRVRSVRDPSGKLDKAIYGKIYGDFVLDPINSKTTWITFTYYLNPTFNDRNLEFDPKQNLFHNLPEQERVSGP
jgi:hypothetical protein